jgi:hypothetical protein
MCHTAGAESLLKTHMVQERRREVLVPRMNYGRREGRREGAARDQVPSGTLPSP